MENYRKMKKLKDPTKVVWRGAWGARGRGAQGVLCTYDVVRIDSTRHGPCVRAFTYLDMSRSLCTGLYVLRHVTVPHVRFLSFFRCL